MWSGTECSQEPGPPSLPAHESLCPLTRVPRETPAPPPGPQGAGPPEALISGRIGYAACASETGGGAVRLPLPGKLLYASMIQGEKTQLPGGGWPGVQGRAVWAAGTSSYDRLGVALLGQGSDKVAGDLGSQGV